MKLVIKIRESCILSLCLTAYLGLTVMNGIVSSLFSSSIIWERILLIWIALVLLAIWFKLIQKPSNIRNILILVSLVTILFAFSYLMGNLENVNWFRCYLRIIIFIFLVIAACNISDKKELLHFFHVAAVVSTPIIISTVLLSYRTWNTAYNISIGYLMCFIALILLTDAFLGNHRAFNIILAIALAVFILYAGSRGPFICFVMFFLMKILLSYQFSLSRKLIYIFVILSLAVIVAFNFNSIMAFAYQISRKLGFDSRTLLLLMQGELSNDSGRNNIWEYYINMVNQRPIIGYGIMGGWMSDEVYPHNIFIEFILSFGYPIGILLFIFVIAFIIRGIRCKDKYDSSIIILFGSLCSLLMISSSYLQCWQFFMCLAFCWQQSRKEKSLTNRI